MKKICLVCAMVICLLVTGCSQKERIVYQSDILTISRSGREICVLSADTNKAYLFTMRRTKRKESGTVAVKTIIQEDGFTVTSTGDTWLIETPTARTFIHW